jgi:type VI secretion system protein ImpK
MNRPDFDTPAAIDAHGPAPAVSRTNTLALFYQGLLTATVRVQSGRQRIADVEAFRGKAKAALQEVERDAQTAGYDLNDIKETHFAVVAFLDAVILRSDEPIRVDWERRPLQEELFGHAHAGDVFFDKLNRMSERRDSPELADILEVFLLCLLLGFQGRYSGPLGMQVDGIADDVRHRIERIRGPQPSLWPTGLLPATFQAVAATKPDRRILYAVASAVAAALLVFTVLKSYLVWSASNARFAFM